MTQLEELNSAIRAIQMGAQEYSIGSRRVRKADLKVLLDERDRLERKEYENAGYGVSVAQFTGR